MDHAGLLQALPFPDQPCGDDLSFSAAFDQIQEARRFDDAQGAVGDGAGAEHEGGGHPALSAGQVAKAVGGGRDHPEAIRQPG